jgi:hypothetical protein
VLLSVWPNDSATVVGLLVRSEHEADLEHYVKVFTEPPFGLLSMIETWMVHGTDHWFLRPSVWNLIPSERRELILRDVLDTSRNIGMEYERSIFDGLRTHFLAQFPEDCRVAWAQFLARERMKMTAAGAPLPPEHPAYSRA